MDNRDEVVIIEGRKGELTRGQKYCGLNSGAGRRLIGVFLIVGFLRLAPVSVTEGRL